MKKNLNTIFISLAYLILISTTANAKSNISISDAKILVPLKGTPVTAGYGILKNNSAQEVTLKIKSVKPFKAVELHETVEKDGKVGMNKVEQIIVPPNGKFELKPGSHHMMLFEPSRTLKSNEQLVAEFEENGKTISLQFKVYPRETDSTDHSQH